MANISLIFSDARPSPYGFFKELLRAYSAGSESRTDASETIFSGSVPARTHVPASTPSGRSVESRVTMTGLPRLGASSCTPPLSDMAKAHRSISQMKSS